MSGILENSDSNYMSKCFFLRSNGTFLSLWWPDSAPIHTQLPCNEVLQLKYNTKQTLWPTTLSMHLPIVFFNNTFKPCVILRQFHAILSSLTPFPFQNSLIQDDLWAMASMYVSHWMCSSKILKNDFFESVGTLNELQRWWVDFDRVSDGWKQNSLYLDYEKPVFSFKRKINGL